MSAILYATEEQRHAAEDSRDRLSAALGNIYTRIAPLERFYLAEDYHQKYRLRNTPPLYHELRAAYPDPTDFRESTAAARINGYLDGNGQCSDLKNEIDRLGLGEAGQKLLLRTVCPASER
jgi:peptide-methionine (S)-S-oxide reductase